MLNVPELKTKVISFMQRNGPSLPIAISKQIEELENKKDILRVDIKRSETEKLNPIKLLNVSWQKILMNY